MSERRWPWLVSASGLMLSGATAAGATYVHWLPCRGAMLSASILHGYAYGPDFTDACLRRMDSGLPFPTPPEAAEQTALASGLGAAAVVLAVAAWLVLILTLRLPVITRALALLPSAVTVAVLVLGQWQAQAPAFDLDGDLLAGLLFGLDGAAVVALLGLRISEPRIEGRQLPRLVVALWGVTAFSLVHGMAEYVLMTTVWSDAGWDNPPGTGYLTAATPVIAAVGMAVLTLRRRDDRAPQPTGAETGAGVSPQADRGIGAVAETAPTAPVPAV